MIVFIFFMICFLVVLPYVMQLIWLFVEVMSIGNSNMIETRKDFNLWLIPLYMPIVQFIKMFKKSWSELT